MSGPVRDILPTSYPHLPVAVQRRAITMRIRVHPGYQIGQAKPYRQESGIGAIIPVQLEHNGTTITPRGEETTRRNDA